MGSIVQPIFWMVLLGLGFTSALRGAFFEGLDYLTFFAPGIVVMAVFFTAFFSGISVIWDREFGFLKEILVAPVSRTATILGRALGDATMSTAQGLIVLAIAYMLVPGLSPTNLPLALLAAVLTAFQFAGLGIAIGSRMRSFEGFHLINTFIAMPLLFLSGAFYPINVLPSWLAPLIYANPLVYGVDLMRCSLTGVAEFPVVVNITASLLASILLISVAVWSFSRAEAG